MHLGDHRRTRGDGRGEIAAGNRIEGEREIIGAEHDHRLGQRAEHGTQPGGGIDHRMRPAPLPHRTRGLTQLAGGARQFDIAQARCLRQTGFAMRDLHQRIGFGLDGIGIGVEETGNACGIGGGHSLRRPDRRSQCLLHFAT
ncbi:hypothetical protein D3C71_1175390 [compost metagenome]